MGRLVRKKYLVGIPVPYLDRKGKRLDPSLVAKWMDAALAELTECFGGATPIPAAGVNIVPGKVLYEEGQTLAVAGCDNREAFLAKRDRIERFVERMGMVLKQHAVIVLAP